MDRFLLIELPVILLLTLILLASIIGYRAIYKKQEQILAWLIQSNPEHDPQRHVREQERAQVDLALHWLKEGHDLMMLSGQQDAAPLQQRFTVWKLMYKDEIEPLKLPGYTFTWEGWEYDGTELHGRMAAFKEYVAAVLEKRIRREPLLSMTIFHDFRETGTFEPTIVGREDFDASDPNHLPLSDYYWDIYTGAKVWLEQYRVHCCGDERQPMPA